MPLECFDTIDMAGDGSVKRMSDMLPPLPLSAPVEPDESALAGSRGCGGGVSDVVAGTPGAFSVDRFSSDSSSMTLMRGVVGSSGSGPGKHPDH